MREALAHPIEVAPRLRGAASPRRIRFGSSHAVTVVLLLGASFSVVSFFLIRQWELDRMKQEFEHLAAERARALQESLREEFATVEFLRMLYVSSEEVTRDEFQAFVAPALLDRPATHAFQWIYRVPAGAPDGALYSVIFAEPSERSPDEIGGDLASDPAAAEAIHRASQGRMAVSQGIRVGSEGGGHPAVRVFLPVPSRDAATPTPEGFVSAILRIDALGERVFEVLVERGLDFAVADESAPSGARLLYVHWWQPRDGSARAGDPRIFDRPATLRHVRTFEVADRTWSVTFLPAPGFLVSGVQRGSWGVLATGLLLTAILAGNTFRVRRHSSETEALNDLLSRQAAQLEATNRELESFSYSVSHDLRAPLRGLDGFSRALLEDYGDRLDGPGRHYLERIRAAAQRMAQLIDDLLSLSRVARGDLRREQVDLSAIATQVLRELGEADPGRNVDVEIAPGLVAQGDPRLLRILMTNLLGNAWKFTSRNPRARIEFGTVRRNGRPAFFIRDDGAGFDMAYVEKLFGVFQRLHGANEFPGTGIGLATVQRIAHRHGGRVWAEGQEGRGATFYFTL